MKKPKTIGGLPAGKNLMGVKFIYPADGQPYYWYSQWNHGVWGKKDMGSGDVFPLFVADLKEVLGWRLAKEEEA